MAELISQVSSLSSKIQSETKFLGEPEQTSEGRRASSRWSYATPKFSKSKEEMLKDLPTAYPAVVNCANFSKLAYKPLSQGKSYDLIDGDSNAKMFKDVFGSKVDDELTVLESFTDKSVSGYLGKVDSSKSIVVAFKAGLELLTSSTSDYKPLTKANPHLSGLKVMSTLQDSLSALESKFAIVETLKSTMDKYSGYKLYIVGHSVGGSIAALFGFEAQNLGYKPTIVTFGAPKVGTDTTPSNYLKKIVKLFEILSDVIDKADMFEHITSSKFAVFINVETVGDVVPTLPLSFQKLGGVPFFLKDVAPDYPQFLYTQDVDYRLNSRSAIRQGSRYNKGLVDSGASLENKLKELFESVEDYSLEEVAKSSKKADYLVSFETTLKSKL